MLKLLKERTGDYEIKSFVKKLTQAYRRLGNLEMMVEECRFKNVLIAMIYNKEAIASMGIAGTDVNMYDYLEYMVRAKPESELKVPAARNYINALVAGTHSNMFEGISHGLIQNLHIITLRGMLPGTRASLTGFYRQSDDHVSNSEGSTKFMLPHTEIKRYMDDLIAFMNNDHDGFDPLIKAAIALSQFEAIRPFYEGNGLVGRVLLTVYLFQTQVFSPFFGINEAVGKEKGVYRNMLANSCDGSYNDWIGYFLEKIAAEAMGHMRFIQAFEKLYADTKVRVRKIINSQQFDPIMDCIFRNPIVTAPYLATKLQISRGQAVKYMHSLEKGGVLRGDDKQRNRLYVFGEFLDLASRW